MKTLNEAKNTVIFQRAKLIEDTINYYSKDMTSEEIKQSFKFITDHEGEKLYFNEHLILVIPRNFLKLIDNQICLVYHVRKDKDES